MRVASATTTSRKRVKVVADKMKPRERLAELRARARFSVREVAKALGYESPAGYHRYEREAKQGDDVIPLDIVRRLIPLFVGRGHPAITNEDMMLLTDVGSSFPRAVVSGYFTPQRSTNGAGMPVRFRVEPGVYTKVGQEARNGQGAVCHSPLYTQDKQFVAVVRLADGPWYAIGDQLHCVEETEFSPASKRGRRAVVSAPYKGGELVEVVTAEISEDGGLVGHDGQSVDGTVLGVVIGFYRAE